MTIEMGSRCVSVETGKVGTVMEVVEVDTGRTGYTDVRVIFDGADEDKWMDVCDLIERVRFEVARDRFYRLALAYCDDDPMSAYYGVTAPMSVGPLNNLEDETGWTWAELSKEIERRTSARWVHFHSPFEVFDQLSLDAGSDPSFFYADGSPR